MRIAHFVHLFLNRTSFFILLYQKPEQCQKHLLQSWEGGNDILNNGEMGKWRKKVENHLSIQYSAPNLGLHLLYTMQIDHLVFISLPSNETWSTFANNTLTSYRLKIQPCECCSLTFYQINFSTIYNTIKEILIEKNLKIYKMHVQKRSIWPMYKSKTVLITHKCVHFVFYIYGCLKGTVIHEQGNSQDKMVMSSYKNKNQWYARKESILIQL